MKKEEIIEFCEMKAELEAENEDIYETIIKALEQQPCEDCISREAVDEYITNLLSGYLYDEERTRLEDLTVYIWELPFVTLSRSKGKWIHWTDDYKDYVTCSCCEYGEEGEVLLNDKTPFCPICGADMRESEGESE